MNENDDSVEAKREEGINDELGGEESDPSNEIKIDFSKVDQPVNGITKEEDFEQTIISQIEERTKKAQNKVAPDLDLQKEREEVKKHIIES